jgi:hypothetical protein
MKPGMKGPRDGPKWPTGGGGGDNGVWPRKGSGD